MKKTISINISNTAFHLEEDAYAALDAYLESVRAYFATDSENQEIMKDIESRIAERFLESGSKAITLSQVEEVIKDMGTVEQLAEASEPASAEAEPKARSRRMLYRDPDNAILAGISAGLGHYFNLDPILFRVLFIVLTFTSGIGILLYIILWIVVPEARTASQKLAMRGNPINLSTMRDIANDAFRDGMSKAANPFRKFVKFLERKLPPFIRICVGILMGIIAFGGIVTATIAAGMALSGYPVTLFDPTVAVVLRGLLFHTAVIALYIAIIAPLAFIALCASDLLFKTSKVTKANVLLILSIWFVSLTAAGVLVTNTVFKSMEAVANDPRAVRETRVIEAGAPFTKINAKDVNVKLVQGDQVKIEAEGQRRSIDNLDVNVIDGKLMLENKVTDRECLFCYSPSPTITITVPSIDEIILENSSSISGKVANPSLSLTLLNSSRANLEIAVQSLDIKLENGSRATLSGTAAFGTSTLQNSSRLEAAMLKAESMMISASNGSRAQVSVSKSLSVIATDGSRIEYEGGAAISERKLADGSKLVDLAALRAKQEQEEKRREDQRARDMQRDAPEAPSAPDAE